MIINHILLSQPKIAQHCYDYATLTANGDETGYKILYAGKTLKVYMTDNIRGDDILTGQEGQIIDAVLPIVAVAVPATSIPTLSFLRMFLLTSLLSIFGIKAINKK